MIARWLIRSQLAEIDTFDYREQRILTDDIAGFVRRAKYAAAAHVRIGLFVLETVFTMVVLGAAWPRPESTRGRALTRFWLRLPDPAPNLIRFYASMTALRAFEHPILRRRYAFPDPDERAERMRMERLRVLGTAP